MKYLPICKSLLFILPILLSCSSVRAQNIEILDPSLISNYLPGKGSDNSILNLDPLNSSENFSNPIVKNFRDGCTDSNLNRNRFPSSISSAEKIMYCRAFQGVSDQLNGTNWSPKLNRELQAIWKVFMDENVVLRPMRQGIPKAIVLAAEPFTNGGSFGFNASVYIRPQYLDSNAFFLLAMHELQHVYDFHTLWKTGRALPEAELEKRGFRIMGKIARETRENEKFNRLPKVWRDSWSMYAESKIDSKMETSIEKFMKKSNFYKVRLQQPDRYVVSFGNRPPSIDNSTMAASQPPSDNGSQQTESVRGKLLTSSTGETWWENDAPPRLVRNKSKTPPSENIAVVKTAKKADLSGRLPEVLLPPASSAKTIEPELITNIAGITTARNKESSEDLLSAAVANEKLLYYKMDKLSYDEEFQLQCWRDLSVTDRYSRKRTVSRNDTGKPIFRDEVEKKILQNRKDEFPPCILDIEPINSDVSETFWSASYLDEMPVKFDYFTKLNGVKMARYTVYKPARPVYDRIAAKYPHIKNFRVFVGTIFISVEDSQIIKFWGSSYPEEDVTGDRAKNSVASYNSTASRQKLASGIWVTTSLNTVAVAEKNGKMKPFRYAVKYDNFQSKSEIEKKQSDLGN